MELSQVLHADSAQLQIFDSALCGLSPTVMTIEEHKSLFKNIVSGDMPEVGEVKLSFERLVRDAEPIKAELKKFKVAELEAMNGPMFRKENKPQLINSVYARLMNDYGFLTVRDGCLSISGYGDDARTIGIRKRLASLTAADLEFRREKANAQIAEHKAKIDKIKNAISNPTTKEDFETLVKYKGEESLTPDQRILRDELVAAEMKAKLESAQLAKAQVDGVKVDTEVEIIKTQHTRDHYDLFVVRFSNRVSPDEFKQLLASAKKLGGWYSSYQASGAIPGFQFKVESDAESFKAICRGDTVNTSNKIIGAIEEKKSTAVERLRVMAERLHISGSAALNQTRKTNTHRRAMQASRTEGVARELIALANTMQNIANAIESGAAKHLDKLRDRAQVEMFIRFIKNAKSDEILSTSSGYAEQLKREGEPATLATIEYVKFPDYSAYGYNLSPVIKALRQRPGMVRLADRVQKMIPADNQDNVKLRIPAELAEEVFAKLGSAKDQVCPMSWLLAHERRERLQKMGITSIEQLRAACREFLEFQGDAPKVDKAVQLERALVGAKVGIDFFPTPKHVAREMVQMSGLSDCLHRNPEALEPQAGNGNIAEAIRETGVEPDVAEISSQLREILEAKKFNLVAWDFLEYNTKQYDFIFANPPFGNNADIMHTRHAYSLLKENGVLTTIVGEGAFFRSGATESNFRNWLDEIGAEITQLPDGTFNDHTLLATTNTNARIVKIIKRVSADN
ncbi:DNA methyltransferase family protein [Undibacterium oligocarboniphilum]|uniref:Methyltransferase small domain-containing protein n=1 Tax=Undibacterium oligocarboniphilum TaxID=666702 RepID=A0A850QSQ1_9BURK|nr:class I SAM-dependent methyltransferase [Undibacterium oligocarboniphilum]MBC3871748.1 hypothetical protein [Undibacterium oligocarboniphilum]NVO79384.1 hypothetical protein [Undibacterium oligocarboniphilum]